MKKPRPSAAKPEALTTGDLISALRTCFDQASMTGMSIADYFGVRQHNQTVSRAKAAKRPSRKRA